MKKLLKMNNLIRGLSIILISNLLIVFQFGCTSINCSIQDKKEFEESYNVVNSYFDKYNNENYKSTINEYNQDLKNLQENLTNIRRITGIKNSAYFGDIFIYKYEDFKKDEILWLKWYEQCPDIG